MSFPYLRQKNETIEDYFIRLYDNKDQYGLNKYQIAELLNKESGTNYDESKWRKDYAQYLRWKSYLTNKEFNDADKSLDIDEIPINYKETVEINHDGTHKSDKLLRMSADESKDPNFLLKAHGYDINEWELISARNNIWNVYSKRDGVQTLYSSKIVVKPLKNSNNIDKLIESIKCVQPIFFDINITDEDVSEKRLLEIPLFDAHFGISDYEYYKPTQMRIMNRINSRKWEQILFIIGQDLLHNDDFRGRTANGTPIETVDIEKAWNDCRVFYEPLIEQSIKNQAKSVKIMYSKGNHDESLSWAFVQYLKARFPQAEFDDSIEERKAHTFGEIFIGITHGDKAAKELHNIFPVEFPLEWSRAKVREIHKGHFHVEDGKDNYGTMVRTLATRNKTDKWHRDKGFVGSHKRFMLFEYSEKELESIHYV